MPFARPTTTATPDEIFEEWVHVLRHGELLALLYIVRRTLGFKKEQDSISYTQFLHGIVTREGKVLDRGCGITSRTTLAAALRRLEELRLIRSDKMQDARGDRATTRYSLWFAGDDDQGAADHAVAEGQTTAARVTVPARGGARTVPPPYADRTTGGTIRVLPVVRGSYPQQTVETTNTTQQTVLSKRTPTVVHVASPLDSTDSTTSTGELTSTAMGESPSPVATAVAHLSAEFGDDAPRASQTRVANMQRAAGLDDADLRPLLDEAAAIARSQAGAITKRGRGGEIVRMPYLLATLRDLVDAPGDTVSRAATGGASAPTLAPFAPSGPGVLGGAAASTGDDPPADSAAAAVWRAVLGEVREVLTPENYAVWFAPACALALEGDVLRVAVPTAFHADWLTHKLGGRVRQALERTGQARVRVAYDIVEPGMAPSSSSPPAPLPSSVAAAGLPARPPAPVGHALGIERVPGADPSPLVVACPLCRAAPCRCRPAERSRRAVTARGGDTTLAGRGAP